MVWPIPHEGLHLDPIPPQKYLHSSPTPPQLLLFPPLSFLNSSILATRSLNSSYWHFSYECLSLYSPHTHILAPFHLPPPNNFSRKRKTPLPQSASKKGIPHTSTAGRILQSGTGSAGSGGWRTSRGRRGGGGRRTFLLAWRGVGCWCLVGTGG